MRSTGRQIPYVLYCTNGILLPVDDTLGFVVQHNAVVRLKGLTNP
jgi:hypothetical protein